MTIKRFLFILMLLLPAQARAGEVLLTKNQLGKSHDRPPVLYVLSVGVSLYKDAFWPKLKWPQKDAADIAAIIGEGMSVPRLTTTLTNDHATRAKVWAALAEIKKAIKPRDSLVIYVSSHGTLAPTANGDLEKIIVLSDTIKDRLLSTGLRHTELFRELRQFRNAIILVIFASCHSGIGKSKFTEDVQKLLTGVKGSAPKIEEKSEGNLVFAAAEQGETAHESDQLQGDVYTHFFIEGLRVNDRNQDGAFSALEAHDYATIKTYAATGGKQRPTADVRMIGSGDMELRGKKKSPGLPVLTGYDFSSLFVSIGGGEKGALPLAFPLVDGRNQISLFEEGGREPLASYLVEADLGETIPLKDVIAGPPYSVGVSLYQTFFTSKDYCKLMGECRSSSARVAANFERQGYRLGALVEKAGSKYRTIRQGLDLTLESSGFGVTFGANYNFVNGFGSSFELLAMQDRVVLVFSDHSGSSPLGYQKTAFAYGYQLEGRYALGGRFQLALDLTQKFSKLKFGDLGVLDQGYVGIGAGFNIRIGGHGVRL